MYATETTHETPSAEDTIRGVGAMLGNLGEDAAVPRARLQELVAKYGPTAAIGLLFGPLADAVWAALQRTKAARAAQGRRIATEYTIDIRPTKFRGPQVTA